MTFSLLYLPSDVCFFNGLESCKNNDETYGTFLHWYDFIRLRFIEALSTPDLPAASGGGGQTNPHFFVLTNDAAPEGWKLI